MQTLFASQVGRVNPPKLQGKHHEVMMEDGATMTFDVYEPNDTKPEEVRAVNQYLGTNESVVVQTQWVHSGTLG